MSLPDPVQLSDSAGPDDWKLQGACRGVDPELFFLQRGESVREAKAVCAGCPVRVRCLAYAMDNGERLGIWGGASARERYKMRSRTKPCAMCGRMFRIVAGGATRFCSGPCRVKARRQTHNASNRRRSKRAS